MAKVTTNRTVKTSCKNTKVRTATGACAPERKPMMKSGGTTFGMLSVKAGVDKNPKPTVADRIAGAKMSNKKMAVGGATESCGPGKPKGCGYAKAQRHNKRSKAMSKVGPVIGKVLTTAATIGGLAYGAMKGKKMLENKKSGGQTKPLPKAQAGTIFKQNDPNANFIQNVRRNSLINRSKKVGEKINNSAKTGDRENTIKLINTQDKLDDKRYELRKKIDSKLDKQKLGGATHPGFKAVQSKIAAKQGISKEAAGAILASSTRKASAKAKAANPRLKRVKG